jgi:alkyl sulfatase BDS1-like metallo-beta-lactamase superfamily hydrolase
VGSRLCGSHFIEERLTDAFYRLFLGNELQLRLENASLRTRRQMWIHHDGTRVAMTRNAAAAAVRREMEMNRNIKRQAACIVAEVCHLEDLM